MTIQENAKLTVENVISDYNYTDRRNGSKIYHYSYWEVLAIIKHAYEINAFDRTDAERYCHNMHCTFDEMMTA